ncbi:MAG: hypothetical protein H0W25_18655, partial [Acidimicrobiia bacterium]|nr:hypothetical protein [Acidimicrobiia bacterium]
MRPRPPPRSTRRPRRPPPGRRRSRRRPRPRRPRPSAPRPSAPRPRRPEPTPARRRLDHELVRRGLVASRERARQEIVAGRVTVGGAPADKPARLVDAGEPIALVGPAARFVSRGGEKLDAALERFEVDVAGRRALDAGASTGGFTDCLLQRGAASVVAVDVGYGQIHERLRHDPRVEVRERVNVRMLRSGAVVPA